MARPRQHISIDVRDRPEAEVNAISAGLAEPEARCIIVVMGALAMLSTDRARARVLNYVSDTLHEKGTIA